ncbi:MAG: hypothetical protein K2X08_02395 [Chlamydiales bacterium]|nr:hypothetical protein [Chlamydiales bacterium]
MSICAASLSPRNIEVSPVQYPKTHSGKLAMLREYANRKPIPVDKIRLLADTFFVYHGKEPTSAEINDFCTFMPFLQDLYIHIPLGISKSRKSYLDELWQTIGDEKCKKNQFSKVELETIEKDMENYEEEAIPLSYFLDVVRRYAYKHPQLNKKIYKAENSTTNMSPDTLLTLLKIACVTPSIKSISLSSVWETVIPSVKHLMTTHRFTLVNTCFRR